MENNKDKSVRDFSPETIQVREWRKDILKWWMEKAVDTILFPAQLSFKMEENEKLFWENKN